jgi:hypothetical protein
VIQRRKLIGCIEECRLKFKLNDAVVVFLSSYSRLLYTFALLSAKGKTWIRLFFLVRLPYRFERSTIKKLYLGHFNLFFDWAPIHAFEINPKGRVARLLKPWLTSQLRLYEWAKQKFFYSEAQFGTLEFEIVTVLTDSLISAIFIAHQLHPSHPAYVQSTRGCRAIYPNSNRSEEIVVTPFTHIIQPTVSLPRLLRLRPNVWGDCVQW